MKVIIAAMKVIIANMIVIKVDEQTATPKITITMIIPTIPTITTTTSENAQQHHDDHHHNLHQRSHH